MRIKPQRSSMLTWYLASSWCASKSSALPHFARSIVSERPHAAPVTDWTVPVLSRASVLMVRPKPSMVVRALRIVGSDSGGDTVFHSVV
jgi:hypothetical protein